MTFEKGGGTEGRGTRKQQRLTTAASEVRAAGGTKRCWRQSPGQHRESPRPSRGRLPRPQAEPSVWARTGLPATAPPLTPARSPPPEDPAYDADPLLDLDLTPAVDPTEPDPIPDYDFDQTHGRMRSITGSLPRSNRLLVWSL
jgi:hypothetical protein